MSDKKENPILLCPHCKDYVEITKINCKIFRHATLKKNGKQINPHTSREKCQYYITNNLIYGCGKPFRIINNNGLIQAEICDYN